MTRSSKFLSQLENFQQDTYVAAKYLYAGIAIGHAASKSQTLRNRLNETAEICEVYQAATQTGTYITLGRIYDTTSKYNIDALIDSFAAELQLFSLPELERRKLGSSSGSKDWLPGYLDQAHVPTFSDVKRLRKNVANHRIFYQKAVRPVRNKHLAHREKINHREVQTLYGEGTVGEMLRAVTFLLSLHEALWQQYFNGRKPVLKPVRRSVKGLFVGAHNSSAPHERIVQDTKRLMELLEASP